MQRNFDVIIVGAGPAGSTLAYELANKGVRVLLLEKAIFPRYKCCGGGISVRAAKLLGPCINEVIEDSISHLVAIFAGTSRYYGNYDHSIAYMVMREKFDCALMQRAEKAGADILQGVEACGIQFNASGVRVSTAAGDFRSQFMVGADGAGSMVAKTLGVKAGDNKMVGIETEVLVGEEDLARWRSKVAVDLGCIRAGYAWLFPKSDHLSIGIACYGSRARDLKDRYWQFLNSLDLKHYSIARWAGGFMPMFNRQAVVARGRAALVGDAAGLADPLTGEGIHHAILSAQLAAPVLMESLTTGKAELSDYQKAVEQRILPEIRAASLFAKLWTLLPFKLFKMLERDERVWRAFCYLMRGEIDCSTLKSGISARGGLHTFILRR